MKVLLVNPTAGPDSNYGALAKASTEMPMLGLAAVASALTAVGHEVRVIDKSADGVSDDEILSIVRRDGYGAVGISAYVTTKGSALRLAEKVKTAVPDVILMVGGPEVTLDPLSFEKRFVDYIFLGEADESVVELFGTFEGGEAHTEVSGVLSRRGDRFDGVREIRVVDDLNSLPPVEVDRFYNLERYYPPVHVRGRRVINAISSRGCPYPCTFCAAAMISGRRIRRMDARKFIDVLKRYRNKGFDSFTIYDDTFTLDRERTKDICRRIIRENISMAWNCFSRVDVIEPEMLKLMRQSGCYLVAFGIESFNDKTLINLKKGFDARQAHEGIRMVKDAGMGVYSSFMIGLPGETKADIEYTVSEVLRSDLDFTTFPVFEPYRGTPIYEDCVRQGRWVKKENDFNRMLVDQDEIWVPHSISRAEIVDLARCAMRNFYLRPTTIWKMVRWGMSLPASRWLRVAGVGIDYFVLQRLADRRKGNVGSRFR